MSYLGEIKELVIREHDDWTTRLYYQLLTPYFQTFISNI